MDSDDWVGPDFLAHLLSGLTEADADICECGVLRTAGEDLPPTGYAPPEGFEPAEAMEQLIHDGVFRQHVWNKLYRRQVIGSTLFPKGKTNEDEFWTYRVFGSARKVAKIPNILYFYFQRPGSIMGETYSLKRLDALEAKLERQAYIDAHFPQLSRQARLNLFGSCIYAGQMSLLHLSGEPRAAAEERLRAVVSRCGVSLRDCAGVGGSNKLWYILAKLSFWGTCKVKNLLKKGF